MAITSHMQLALVTPMLATSDSGSVTRPGVFQTPARSLIPDFVGPAGR
jgi:hypothetical protein